MGTWGIWAVGARYEAADNVRNLECRYSYILPFIWSSYPVLFESSYIPLILRAIQIDPSEKPKCSLRSILSCPSLVFTY